MSLGGYCPPSQNTTPPVGAGPGEYSRGVIVESKQFWNSHSATKEQEATEEQMHKLNFPPAIYSYLQPIYSI